MDELTSVEQFLFGTPLYVELSLPPDMKLKGFLTGHYSAKADGYCPFCKKQTTYSLSKVATFSSVMTEAMRVETLQKILGFDKLSVSCARNSEHKLNYWFYLKINSVLKVGQFPSLADIANDESSSYRKVLSKTDSNELHKAIGLAAHGVGIGSFVYLRRIFERLVLSRFEEFKDIEGWDLEAFNKMRMNEKVEFLKGHLPSFLVENSKLYSILSLGIHELSDEACLAAFEPIKLSLKIILEDDKKKLEELELRRMASIAIQSFSPSKA